MASQRREATLLWARPSWRIEAEEWIRERLAVLGRIEQPHIRPWATALRIPADDGTFWFKASIEPLAYEVPLVERLARRRPDCLPETVAADARRGWLLMRDAGVRVTDLHEDGAPVETWERFMREYAQLQIDVSAEADALVALGVPDRRTPTLIERFPRVLENDRLVRPPTQATLDDEELAHLHALVPRLVEAAEAVAALGLPDSIHHDDLHTSNVCVGDGGYRFIDWGDACVAQPLLSLSVPRFHLEDEAAWVYARGAYLEPWTAFSPVEELLAACDAAILLAQITGVLKWELINSGLSDEERVGYEDVIPRRLRHLLELTCA